MKDDNAKIAFQVPFEGLPHGHSKSCSASIVSAKDLKTAETRHKAGCSILYVRDVFILTYKSDNDFMSWFRLYMITNCSLILYPHCIYRTLNIVVL